MIKIGSERHKERFCRQFIASHQQFQPETLPWPELDEDALARMRAVPFWQEVLHTERRAGAIVAAFAGTIADPLVREAVELQGIEEARHARLIEVMIGRYGLPADEQPPEPLGPDPRAAFSDFGYGECLDSFLGFGVFRIARQASFLPEPLFRIFDTLMFEETRHIVFFVNWMAWDLAQRGRPGAAMRGVASLWYYGRAIGRLLGTIRRGKTANDGKDFSATQAGIFLDGFTFRRFVEACYSENARRMADFQADLLQPRFLPAVAAAALSGLRLVSRRVSPPAGG
ncbi:MAG: ferritin-like domain-containing protein [Alphaproteobacteria bacterium]|nr:ferritin-like domain-containing protein [Alphaproteobacteria bacterium]MBV9862993.1 ferritin-like domain-containing protein [Alphaproteobacteria bacterium]